LARHGNDLGRSGVIVGWQPHRSAPKAKKRKLEKNPVLDIGRFLAGGKEVGL